MSHTCFYCGYEIEENKIHEVTLIKSQQESDETLCDVCYSDWLEGIK
ncbi:hypothetical protein J2S13_001279 [Oikeobacillus pervagus]|uniref:Uncharacterized protein n=1 Tax=Oikeobacillus pervagus TaxID=1325931 RepID=A0AAJ1T148_9BACI|nr:hypothetical protein [Oikeobacillus pervagus]MDQ0214882.1 hypothetical protein [Oikeobacillus pervagus]